MANDLLNHPNVPRYVKLAEEIRAQMRARHLKPGDQLPSFTEMKAQGIGQNTLERAHALLEREGLVVRERGRGVFVAKSLSITTPTIGLVQAPYAKTHHTYFSSLLEGIQQVAQDEHIKLTLLSPELAESQWDSLDGVLVWEGNPGKKAIQPPPQLPQVSLLLPAENQPSVNITDYAGVKAATEHLIQLGHKRITYLLVSDHPVLATRLQAYHDALTGAGIKPDPAWVRKKYIPFGKDEHLVAQGRKAMAAWLEEWRELGCTAILAQNDFVALGALDVLKQAGYRVPDDVSLVGFDGLDICDLVEPRLTTVEAPLEQVGATSMQLLLSQIRNQSIEPQIELPTRLKIQESTAPPLNP